jgi:hypothetical protein
MSIEGAAWSEQPLDANTQDGFVKAEKKRTPKASVSKQIIPSEFLCRDSESVLHRLSGLVRHIMCSGSPSHVKQNPTPMTIEEFWKVYRSIDYITIGKNRINVNKNYSQNHFYRALTFFTLYVISNYENTEDKYTEPLDEAILHSCVANVRKLTEKMYVQAEDLLVDYYLELDGMITIPIRVFVNNYLGRATKFLASNYSTKSTPPSTSEAQDSAVPESEKPVAESSE